MSTRPLRRVLVRSPLLWSLAYRVLAARWFVLVAARGLRIFGRWRGPQAMKAAIDFFGNALVWSGFPIHSAGWRNIELLNFRLAVQAELVEGHRRVPRIRRPEPTSGRPLRVAVFGPLNGHLVTQRGLFDDVPDEIELSLFDVPFRGQAAGYLETEAFPYRLLPAAGGAADPVSAEIVADALNASDADLVLLFATIDVRTLLILDRLDVPAVAFFSVGVFLSHPKIDFTFMTESYADYFCAGERLFSAIPRRFVVDRPAYPAFAYYDSRGIEPGPGPSWYERQPLMVVHGSIWKVDSPGYLDCLYTLLEEDPELRLVLMGVQHEEAFSSIMAQASSRGVAERVEYLGSYSSARDAAGVVSDPGWLRLKSLLRRARLAPSTWPVTGGYSRFEAYVSGVPAPHMRPDDSQALWAREQPGELQQVALNVPRLAATTPADYLELCRRCLHDPHFAAAAVAEQLALAEQLSDSRRFWLQIRARYLQWAGGVGPRCPGVHPPEDYVAGGLEDTLTVPLV